MRIAWKHYNLSLGLGLNKVAGKVFRIGHLGWNNEVRATLRVRTSRYAQNSSLTLLIKPRHVQHRVNKTLA